MNDNRSNPIVHLLPSLTDVAFLMPLIFMFTKLDGASALLCDGDTGWHIRTGEWILANHRVPYADIFSFTKPGAPWFAWEWLSDVLFGLLHLRWGLAGVALFGTLLLCFTSALLFRLIERRCRNPFISIIFTFLAVASSTIHWHARPHLFTIFFTVVFLHILDRVHAGEARWLWALPLLTAVWTNLHGGFFVGLTLLACYCAGELISAFVEADREHAKGRLILAARYGITFAGCSVATLINPYTFRLHLFIWHFLGQPFIDVINEYSSPNFHSPHARFFETLLLAAVALVFWSAMRRRFADVLIVLGWAHFALFGARNVPIFAVAAAPIAAGVLEEVLQALREGPVSLWCRSLSNWLANGACEFAILDRTWRIHLISVLAFCAIAIPVASGKFDSKLKARFDPKVFPVDAAAVLASRPAGTRVFTLDQWADFLIYRLYPDWRVFYDGRADMYGNDFVEQYGKILNVGFEWERTFQNYRIESVLLPVDAPLAGALKQAKDWRAVYDDHHAILFDRVTRPQQAFRTAQVGIGRDREVAAGKGRDPAVAASVNRDRPITPRKSI